MSIRRSNDPAIYCVQHTKTKMYLDHTKLPKVKYTKESPKSKLTLKEAQAIPWFNALSVVTVEERAGAADPATLQSRREETRRRLTAERVCHCDVCVEGVIQREDREAEHVLAVPANADAFARAVYEAANARWASVAATIVIPEDVGPF